MTYLSLFLVSRVRATCCHLDIELDNCFQISLKDGNTLVTHQVRPALRGAALTADCGETVEELVACGLVRGGEVMEGDVGAVGERLARSVRATSRHDEATRLGNDVGKPAQRCTNTHERTRQLLTAGRKQLLRPRFELVKANVRHNLITKDFRLKLMSICRSFGMRHNVRNDL